MAVPGGRERRHDSVLHDVDSRRPLQAVLVALFLAVISLPLAATLAGVDGADPGAENRELAAFPHVDLAWPSIAALPANIGLWFDDHFGFRSTLIRWHAWQRCLLRSKSHG